MNQATEKLVTDFKVLMSDSEDLVKATAAQTGDNLVEVRNRIQRSAADLKPKLAEAEAALLGWLRNLSPAHVITP